MGDGHQGRRAVGDGAAPVVRDARLSFIDVELDPVLLGCRRDSIVGS